MPFARASPFVVHAGTCVPSLSPSVRLTEERPMGTSIPKSLTRMRVLHRRAGFLSPPIDSWGRLEFSETRRRLPVAILFPARCQDHGDRPSFSQPEDVAGLPTSTMQTTATHLLERELHSNSEETDQS